MRKYYLAIVALVFVVSLLTLVNTTNLVELALLAVCNITGWILWAALGMPEPDSPGNSSPTLSVSVPARWDTLPCGHSREHRLADGDCAACYATAKSHLACGHAADMVLPNGECTMCNWIRLTFEENAA